MSVTNLILFRVTSTPVWTQLSYTEWTPCQGWVGCSRGISTRENWRRNGPADLSLSLGMVG